MPSISMFLILVGGWFLHLCQVLPACFSSSDGDLPICTTASCLLAFPSRLSAASSQPLILQEPPLLSTSPIIPIPFFFSSISILFWQNFKSDHPTFWLLHLMSVSEQLTASKKHRDCAYRTRFKCVSTDLQTQHTPGSPDMGKFPSYLHILSWTCKNLVLHGENGWNHMGNNLSLHTFISNFLLDLIRHLELFSLELTIKS